MKFRNDYHFTPVVQALGFMGPDINSILNILGNPHTA